MLKNVLNRIVGDNRASTTSSTAQPMNYATEVNMARARAPLALEDKYGYDVTTNEFLNIIASNFPEIKQTIYRNKNSGLKALIEYWKMNQNKKNKDFEKKTDPEQEAALKLFNTQKRFNSKNKAEKNLIFDGDIEKQIPKDVADAIKNLGLSQAISIKNGKLMAPHNMTDFNKNGRKISAYTKQEELKPLTNVMFNSILQGLGKITSGWAIPRNLGRLSNDTSKINRLPEIKILKSYIGGKFHQKINGIRKQIQKDKNPKYLAKKVFNMKKYIKQKGRVVPNDPTNVKNFISAKDFRNHNELIDNLKGDNIMEHKDNAERIQNMLENIIDGGDIIEKKKLAKYAKYSKKYIDDYL